MSENDVDEVIIALPFRERQKIMDLAFTCEENYVKAFVVPDLFELIMEEIDINTLEGVPLMGLKDIPLSGWSLPVKRIEDLVFSAIGLILSSPLLIICAVLVKLSSPALSSINRRESAETAKFLLCTNSGVCMKTLKKARVRSGQSRMILAELR